MRFLPVDLALEVSVAEPVGERDPWQILDRTFDPAPVQTLGELAGVVARAIDGKPNFLCERRIGGREEMRELDELAAVMDRPGFLRRHRRRGKRRKAGRDQ